MYENAKKNSMKTSRPCKHRANKTIVFLNSGYAKYFYFFKNTLQKSFRYEHRINNIVHYTYMLYILIFLYIFSTLL